MARTLPLLDAAQRREFDRPPPFQPTQRRLFFTLPEWATQVLATLVAPHSQGGFVLQERANLGSARSHAGSRRTRQRVA